jgi:hypothetical protein
MVFISAALMTTPNELCQASRQMPVFSRRHRGRCDSDWGKLEEQKGGYF